MKNRRFTANLRSASAGFTLVELAVVVLVFGIVVTLAAVGMTDFMAQQNAKAEAFAFHKDLMALRGRALDQGDTIQVTFNPAGTNYTVKSNAPGAAAWTALRTVELKKSTVTCPNREGLGVNGDLPSEADAIKTNNDWSSAITIYPGSADAFGSVGTTGWVVFNKGNHYYCILKSRGSARPQLYSKKGTTGTWKKM